LLYSELDTIAYKIYCSVEGGYDNERKKFKPIMAFNTFVSRKKEYYYDLAKKELRKEKLNELQRIAIH
jgi:hypothetical protein